MAELRLSVAARRDLDQIVETGIRDHGARAAERHVDGFRRLFQLLREHPLAGQDWLDPGLGVRTLSHRPHRIVYRVLDDLVIVDRILHQARDIGRALKDEQ